MMTQRYITKTTAVCPHYRGIHGRADLYQAKLAYRDRMLPLQV
jgi:hypothetical protein